MKDSSKISYVYGVAEYVVAAREAGILGTEGDKGLAIQGTDDWFTEEEKACVELLFVSADFSDEELRSIFEDGKERRTAAAIAAAGIMRARSVALRKKAWDAEVAALKGDG